MPGMGTGVGGLKKSEAAKAMVDTIRGKKFFSIEHIMLIDLDGEMVAAFEKEMKRK
jgi:O-acetyl-ADP-ribose deacetylase (regulator of RNase III)